MIDYIVIAIIITCLGFIVRYSVKKRKSGKNIGCGCGCDHCASSSNCHSEK